MLLPQHLYVNDVISEEKKTNLNNVEKSLKIYFLILLDLQRSMDMMILDTKDEEDDEEGEVEPVRHQGSVASVKVRVILRLKIQVREGG